MEDLEEKLRGVMNGRLRGEDVGVRSVEISPVPNLKVRIDKENLKAEQFRLSLVAAAADFLHLPTVSASARLGINFVSALALRLHNYVMEPLTVDEDDVAETALALLGEFKSAVTESQKDSDTSTSSEKTTKKSKKSLKQQKKEEALQEEREGQMGPETSEDSSDSDRDGEVSALQYAKKNKKNTKKIKKSQKQQQKKEAVQEEPQGQMEPETSEDSSDSDRDGEVSALQYAKKNQKNTKKIKKSQKQQQKKEALRRVHYVPRKCPLCKKEVVHMKRHLVAMHVKKNECLPTARVEALLEMAKFGNSTHGGSVISKNKEGVRREYKRPREICPKCDRVVLYLSTHLVRTHKLPKTSEEYKTLMFMARRYRGKSNELKWDRKIISRNTKRQKQGLPTRSRRPSSSSDEERPINPLALLAEEDLPEDTSDESFHDMLEETVPASPQPEPRSTMRAKPPGRADFNVENSLGGNEQKAEEEGDEKELEEEEEEEMEEEEDELEEEEDELEEEEEELEEEEDELEEEEEEQEEEEEEDIGEGENESYKTWRSFYQNAKGSTVMERLLIGFCRHLQNILGGCKSERDAIQHAQNVRRCLTTISPIMALSSLLKDGGLLIWKTWAKPLLDSKKVRPGTIRASLTSIIKFLQYIVDVTEHQVEGVPHVDHQIVLSIRQVVPRLIAMGSSVSQLYAHEKWEQVLEDQMRAINPEDTRRMSETTPARRAMTILLRAATHPLERKDFLEVRDFLIARIGLENGQRPGPLETARLRDFERIKEIDGKYVMYVARHKNSKAGPAPLTMTSNVRSNLEVFIKKIRPKFAADDEDAIFTTEKGRAFPSGTIGKRIIAWWHRAIGKRLTATRLRKMHASQLHTVTTGEKQSAHRLMCHSSQTAEKYYMIDNLGAMATQGHSTLTRNLQLHDTVETQVSETPGKASLNQDQLGDISTIFANMIATNAPLTITQTKNMMSESAHLTVLVDDPEMVKKVYKRVKYCQKKQPSDAVRNIDEADRSELTSDWVAETIFQGESSSSRRQNWSKEDDKAINSVFSSFEKCPTKSVIKHLFATDPALMEIGRQNSIDRCYNKIKNMFKKINK